MAQLRKKKQRKPTITGRIQDKIVSKQITWSEQTTVYLTLSYNREKWFPVHSHNQSMPLYQQNVRNEKLIKYNNLHLTAHKRTCYANGKVYLKKTYKDKYFCYIFTLLSIYTQYYIILLHYLIWLSLYRVKLG